MIPRINHPSILLFCFFLTLTACGEEKVNDENLEEPKEPVALTLEREKVSLMPGETVSVKITSGNEQYQVKSSGNDVINASVTGDIVTLTAGTVEDKAEAVVVVVDQMFKRASIDVCVANEFEMQLSHDHIILTEGMKGNDAATIFIESGNSGYQLELINNTSSYLEVDETNLETAGKFIIKAIASGSGEIKVTDSKGKESLLTIVVEKAPSLTLNKTDLFIHAVQGKEILTVSNGNGGYTVMFEDPAIAKTAYTTDGGIIAIVGRKNGETTAYIEDQKGLRSDPFTIEVNGPEYAMIFGENYYGYASFKDLEQIDPALTKSRQVTLEMNCYMTGYRGGQTFMGLDNNLLLRGPNDDYKPTHPVAIVGEGLEIESSISFNLNEWTHIALVVDCDKSDIKDKYRLYINGVRDDAMNFKDVSGQHAEVNLASGSDDNKFVVGWASNQYWRWMLGNVSEVRIWKAARTIEQINDNMCSLREADTEGLFARWDFTAGVATDYIQDTGESGYEINMVLSEVKHDDKHFRPVVLPESVYLPKGCP